MARERTDLIDFVAQVGQAPEGVDHTDYIIASLPGGELQKAAKDSTFSYEGLAAIVKKDPTFLERHDRVPHPGKALADDILNRQLELSSTRRRIATLASIIVFGAGGFTVGYKVDMSVQHKVFGSPATAVGGVKPGGDTEEIDNGLFAGGLGGGAAGLLALFTGLSQAGRLARRPAQRKVDKGRLS